MSFPISDLVGPLQEVLAVRDDDDRPPPLEQDAEDALVVAAEL